MNTVQVTRRFTIGALGALAVVLSFAMPASADDIAFGPNDIVTVFYIAKSTNRDRVDYGMRLDKNCAPVNDDAVFPYWRNFEDGPERTTGLSIFQKVPYGFSEQKTLSKSASGGEQLVRLRQLSDRSIVVATKRGANGKCVATARAFIKGVSSQLLWVYAKLAGPVSVDYVDVHGRDFTSGAAVVERIRH